MNIIIDTDGNARHVYNDEFVEFDQALGKSVTARASHVEPACFPDGEARWLADMSPVGGPVLGPFKLRSDALQMEQRWIENHDVPQPR